MARFFERRAGPLFCLYNFLRISENACVKFQPNRDYVSNDDVQTPPELAARLVAHFRPTGTILEPCAGDGAFLNCLPGALWCEIKCGRDFLAFREPVDWIITNPPWSQIRPFLAHSFSLARDVAFLMTVNHTWTKARLREAFRSGFGLHEIVLVPTPRTFPTSGFQLGMVHYQRSWTGDIRFTTFD
jgi:hypothetical protein